MEFSQVQDVFVSLSDLVCKIDGLREEGMTSVFKIKTGKESVQS